MQIKKVNELAKRCMSEENYNGFMSKVNSQQLNSARLFIEDRIDEIVFSRRIINTHDRLIGLRELDTIVTNEYINQIDVKNAETVSIK